MDFQRAMMDELMGKNRNGDLVEKQHTITDPEVCRSFLCGLCPRDLFQNTKAYQGECPKVHDRKLLNEYEEESKNRRDPFGFERDHYADLKDGLRDCDIQIKRHKARVEDDENKIAMAMDDDAEVQRIAAEIKSLVADARAAGERGDVDEAVATMAKVKGLRDDKMNAASVAAQTKMSKEMASYVTSAVSNPSQKLFACDVCGAFLSVTDSDRRLADHFGGKLHVGYAKVREQLAKYDDKLPTSGVGPGGGPDRRYADHDAGDRWSRQQEYGGPRGRDGGRRYDSYGGGGGRGWRGGGGGDRGGGGGRDWHRRGDDRGGGGYGRQDRRRRYD